MGGSYPPGYTGIMRTQEVYDEKPMNKVGEKQIPGYAGYIAGVKSENVHGQTYSKATKLSADG